LAFVTLLQWPEIHGVNLTQQVAEFARA
jgi:hypothetical protein